MAFVSSWVRSYLRRLAKGFSRMAGPINDLLQKERPFVLSEDQASSFADLKGALTPVL